MNSKEQPAPLHILFAEDDADVFFYLIEFYISMLDRNYVSYLYNYITLSMSIVGNFATLKNGKINDNGY